MCLTAAGVAVGGMKVLSVGVGNIVGCVWVTVTGTSDVMVSPVSDFSTVTDPGWLDSTVVVLPFTVVSTFEYVVPSPSTTVEEWV